MNLSEKVLGRRIVNYLKNEALVGRVNIQKIKVSLHFYICWMTFVVFDRTNFVLWQRTSVKKSFRKITSKKKFYPFSKDRYFLCVIFYCKNWAKKTYLDTTFLDYLDTKQCSWSVWKSQGETCKARRSGKLFSWVKKWGKTKNCVKKDIKIKLY